MRTVLIIVPEEGLLFESAGVADILGWVNRQIAAGAPGPGYQVTVATTLRHRVVHGRSGLNLLADVCLGDLDPTAGWDTVMVTGRGQTPEENAAVSDWISLAAPHTRRVVSVCAGALVLAQAGLLDGRRATTHWQRLDELGSAYPKVLVERDSIYVNDGNIWTSAGASTGFDLALALVEEDHGFAAARGVAQDLVMYLRRPGGQSQFSRYLAAQASSPGPIRDVQAWALENLRADLGVEKLADRAAMSPRNFARVFAKETGTTPARFVEDIRLEAARSRLEQGNEGLEEVAAACGLGSALNLRRVFERQLGVNPSQYRERFGSLRMA
jgi:transcriptional regulator GlxA family with amidase domain